MSPVASILLELINNISDKITCEDLAEFRSACKDEEINEDELSVLKSTKDWMQYLVDKSLLKEDDPSFIEHIFELCRRPDLLAIVLEYRMRHLAVNKIDDIGRKLVRVSSSKKYLEVEGDVTNTSNNNNGPIKLSAPPKQRRKSAV